MHTVKTARPKARSVAALACIAALLFGLPGCVGPRSASAISGRAILTGRVPGSGRPFTVGAVRNGKIIKTAKVRPGDRFNLTVPPGHYKVGLWIPGTRQSPLYLTCIAHTTVNPGETSTVNLECMWHG